MHFDARQVISHDVLQQLYPYLSDIELDNLLRSINKDLTRPLTLDASNPSSLVINVGSAIISNAESNRNTSISHIGSILPTFSGGTITFPSASGGNVVCSPGGSTALTVSSGNYIKVSIYLDSSSNLNVVAGTQNAVEASATVASVPPGNIPIGYVTLHNLAGVIQNIAQNKIYQFNINGGTNVTDVSNVSSDVVPAIDNTYDIGTTLKRWKDTYIKNVLHLGTSSSLEGQLRWNPANQKLEFRHLPTDQWSVLSSGGSSDPNDVLAGLIADEANLPTATEPVNTIQDDFFDADKGTKSNTYQSESSLKLKGLQTNGSYTRMKECTIKPGKASGVAVMSLPALGPNSTVIAADAIHFDGDVSSFFPVTKGVVFVKQTIDAAGIVSYKALLDTDDTVAVLTVFSSTYNSSTDITTVVMNNPNFLVLDFGISPSNYNTNLRLVPFDHQFSVKSLTASSFEQMAILDLSANQTIGIPGHNYWTELGNLTGSVIYSDVAFSPNKKYGVVKVIEKAQLIDNNDQIHWFWTKDGGQVWTKFKETRTTHYNGAIVSADEFNGNTYNYQRPSMLVANNGKVFLTYAQYLGQAEIWGVRANLSDDLPELLDVATGYQGGSLGRILGNASYSYWACLAGDLIDLSFIGIVGHASGGGYPIQQYTNGGATALAGTPNSVMHNFYPVAVWCVGTSGSHRMFFAYANSANNLQVAYCTEGSASENVFASESNVDIYGWWQGQNKLFLWTSTHNGADNHIRYIDNLFGSPTHTKVLIDAAANNMANISRFANQQNTNGTYASMYWPLMGNRVGVCDPLDDNHVFLTFNRDNMAGTGKHGRLFEIKDITNCQLFMQAQYAYNGDWDIGQTGSHLGIGQTFAITSGQRIRTIVVALSNLNTNSFLPNESTWRCDVYATSGGAPTGSPIATSTNTIDPAYLVATASNSSKDLVYFNFDSPSLTGMTTGTYAFLVRPVTPHASKSGRIGSYSNNYPSGNIYTWDGTTFTSQPSVDLFFEIHGDNISTIGNYLAKWNIGTGPTKYINDYESQLLVLSNTKIAYISNRVFEDYLRDDPTMQSVGHPHYRILTITPTVVSKTALLPLGYDYYDPNLMLNLSMGDPNYARKGTVDGSRDLNYRAEPIGGNELYNITTYNSPTWVADSRFQSGYAAEFKSNSSQNIIIGRRGNQPWSTYWGQNRIEMELEFWIDPAYAGMGQDLTIVSSFSNVGPGTGWWLRYHTDTKQLQLWVANGSIANTVSVDPGLVQDGDYNRIKLIRIGTTVTFYKWVNNAWSLLSSSGGVPAFIPDGGNDIVFSQASSYAGNLFRGRIGYFKLWASNDLTQTMSYDGFKPQHAKVNLQVAGNHVVCENIEGTNEPSTYYQPFNNIGMMAIGPRNSSVKDSYKFNLSLEKLILGTKGQEMHLQSILNRGDQQNSAALEGIAVRFSKS